MPTVQTAPVNSISRELEEAIALVMAADKAYGGSMSWANQLFAAAEKAHSHILAGIAGLSEEHADSLEPVVSQLEVLLTAFPGSSPPVHRLHRRWIRSGTS